MYPILYNKNEMNFIHNGLGILSGATSVLATEELNGLFELSMEYDSEGFLADEIANDMIVKVKANDKQDLQLFRIYSVTKNHDTGNLVVNARHITNDLASNFVEKLELSNRTTRQAMEAIQANLAYPTRFNISSTNEITTSSTKLYRTNPLQMVAGMDGSILDNWGGQIERDNFNLLMHKRRGSDDGVTVAYSKNLTGLTATFDVSNVVTRIFPFAIKDDKLITISDKYIDSPNIDKYPHIKILPVDYSNDEDITDRASLYKKAKTYFNRGSKDMPEVSMEVSFEPLWHTEEYKDIAVLERVGMGDTVTVWHSKMGVHAKATVVKIEYDPISEKNKAVHIGNVKSRLTDSFSDKVNNIVNDVDQAKTSANEAIKSADGKSTIYYGTDEPTNAQIDDVWFKTVDGEYTRTYRFDGIQWQLVLSMDAEEARNEAKEARNKANEAVANANIATENAQSAINDAQSAFDKAQSAIDASASAEITANSAFTKANNSFNKAQQAITSADSAFNKANDAFSNVKALSTVVDDHTGEISTVKQLATGLQTQVNDQEGNISTLTQIADGLQSKVTDAEGNISTLQQTSKAFATRIADTEGNVSSLTQTALGLQTRVADAEGNISILKQTSEGLSSMVGKVESDLANLEVGGRNLLRDSNFRIGLGNYGAWTANSSSYNYVEVVQSERFGNVLKIVRLDSLDVRAYVDNIELKEGEKYTLSYYAKGTEGAFILNYIADNDNRPRFTNAKEVIVSKAWERKEVVLTVAKSSEGSTQAIKFNPKTDNTEIFIANIKLEKGNKATDWTPAPEDIQSQFSSITQTIDKITMRVQDTEGNISTLQQTSKSLATRFEDAEGNISTLTQISNGLQSQVSDIDGNVTTLTQLSNAMQARLTDAEGNINKLTLTSQSLQSTISGVQSDLDGIEVGGRNLIPNSRIEQTSNNYSFGGRDATEHFVKGETYTLTVNGRIDEQAKRDNKVLRVYLYIDGWVDAASHILTLDSLTNTTESMTFKANWSGNVNLSCYMYPSGGSREGTVTVNWVKLEKGNKATDWTPAPEDQEAYAKYIAELEAKLAREKAIAHADNVVTAEERARINDVKDKLEQAKSHANGLHQETTSQITQLRDNINLRVKKGDIINQINISDESILIDAQKIHITGSTKIDDASITSAKIKSIDAGKITAGTLDAGRVNLINLSAKSIVGGTLQSQNANTYWNLNTGEWQMENNNLTFGNGANINFESAGNTITYRKYDSSVGFSRSSGLGVGLVKGGLYPFAYLGTTGASDLDTLSKWYSGFMAMPTAYIADGAANSVNGNRFEVRNKAVDWDKGFEFNMYGAPTIRPFSHGTHDIGTANYRFRRMYVDNILGWKTIYFSNPTANRGFQMDTDYKNGTNPTFRGQYPADNYYNLGDDWAPFSYGYITSVYASYLRGELQGSSARKFKKNIGDINLDDSLEFVRNAKIVTFDWIRDESLKINKDNPQTKYDRQVGFILDDLKMTNDYLVKRDNETIKKDNIMFMQQHVLQHVLDKTDKYDKSISDLWIENKMLKERIKQLEQKVS